MKYIQPVKFIDQNQCPECEGELLLIETSNSVTTLTKEGMPVFNYSNCDEDVEMKLQCTVCGKEYDVEKEGMFFHIKRKSRKIPKPKKIIRDFNPFYMSK